jgi:hypothetical protein
VDTAEGSNEVPVQGPAAASGVASIMRQEVGPMALWGRTLGIANSAVSRGRITSRQGLLVTTRMYATTHAIATTRRRRHRHRPARDHAT